MICRICGQDGLEPLGVEAFLFPGTSYEPEFHEYENYICPGCGVVSGQPEPTDEALTAHYNSDYRVSGDAVEIGGKTIDTPIDLTIGGRSLARVRNFHDLVVGNSGRLADVIPGADDLVIDFGAYQGMFLHGVRELWGCRCLAYDYSESGIAFAQNFLGFAESKITWDIYTDGFDTKAKFATMIHSLKHLREPARFLEHLREDILTADGYLYIEVPNLYGMAICDPVHFFTYSRESLTRLLTIGGFEVLDMRTSGYPVVEAFTGHNDAQNIICLARPTATKIAAAVPTPDLDVIRSRLRASYGRHSLRAVARQFAKAVRETARFVYYLIFAGILDRLSPRLANGLARKLGRRQ